MNYAEYMTPQAGQCERSRRVTKHCGNFASEREIVFTLPAQLRAIDQRKDVSAFATQTLKRAEAKPQERSLVRVGALAFEALQQLGNEFVIGGGGEFGEIMKRQGLFAQQRIDAAISDVLLN